MQSQLFGPAFYNTRCHNCLDPLFIPLGVTIVWTRFLYHYVLQLFEPAFGKYLPFRTCPQDISCIRGCHFTHIGLDPELHAFAFILPTGYGITMQIRIQHDKVKLFQNNISLPVPVSTESNNGKTYQVMKKLSSKTSCCSPFNIFDVIPGSGLHWNAGSVSAEHPDSKQWGLVNAM